MIIIMKKVDVVAMLEEYLPFTPKLKTGHFYRVNSHDKITIMWSQKPLFLDFPVIGMEEILSIGLPIFMIKKSNLSLYPPFVDCLIDGYENYTIEKTLLTEVSFGNSIKINHPNGICMLSDELGNKIAFGEILSGNFRPFIDLGWYLRFGN